MNLITRIIRLVMFILLLALALHVYNSGAGAYLTGVLFNAGVLFILMHKLLARGKDGDSSRKEV